MASAGLFYFSVLRDRTMSLVLSSNICWRVNPTPPAKRCTSSEVYLSMHTAEVAMCLGHLNKAKNWPLGTGAKKQVRRGDD